MTYDRLCTPVEHEISRRRWMGLTAGGFAGLAGFGQASESRHSRKKILMIWLNGGVSQLETWDPKPNTAFGGPFRSIATTVPGVRVCELLPRCAKIMDRLVVVRSLCTKDREHVSAVERIQRGDPNNRGAAYPYFGAAVAYQLGPVQTTVPPYVVVKPGEGGFLHHDAGFLGPKFGAVVLGDGKAPQNIVRNPSLTTVDETERDALRRRADDRFRKGRRPEAAERVEHAFESAAQLRECLDLFDLSHVSRRDVERYGQSDLGRHLLLGRRLLESGVRAVKVSSSGWDTHGDNFNAHLSMVPKFDQAFVALIEDLTDRGMFDDVLVVVLSEFGRTPRINGYLGRDHWPDAWSLVMAGAGLKRGVVIGSTSAQGTYVTHDEYDIGHVFHTWFRALGVDPAGERYDNNGQPLPIAHERCHAIAEALA